jgi:RNA-binding protein PNO1
MDQDIAMSSAAHTIDPSSQVQSRILTSTSLAQVAGDDDDEMVEQPTFAKLSAVEARGGKTEYRRIRCPAHRYTPLRETWEQILTPLVEFLKLQVSPFCRNS